MRGFVAAIAIITAFAVLATPAAVYAQSSDGPTAKGAIPAQSLRADGWTVTLNVRKYFEASGALVIEVGSLDEAVATASATGETVTIVPVKKGATVIEVTAQNSEGSAVQPISVTVGAAVPPLAYTIDTVAATKYRITNPQDVVVDGDGNIYVVESLVQQGRRIHKVDAAAGTISIIAGTGEDGYNGDGGPATGAWLSFPTGVTVGADCRLYVADTFNHRIRKADAATGTINTIAGTGEQGYGGEGGPATEAQLSFRYTMAVDGDGNVYIADAQNHRIRRVDVFTGIINTIAGTGEQLCCQHGSPATEFRVSFPNGIAVDAFGNVYFTETWGFYVADISGRSEQDRVRVLKPLSGVMLRTPDATVDVAGYFAGFDAVRYEVDSSDYIVATVSVTGSTVTIAALNAGEGVITVTAISSDGTRATRTIPVTVDATALAYTISTITGNNYVWDGEPATWAWLESPEAMAVDAIGNLYIADRGHYRIRKVDAFTRTISTVAGTGEAGSSGDGRPATEAMLSSPHDVAVDAIGNLYIADIGTHRIRKVDAFTGTISTIAGTGEYGDGGDGGPATEAQLWSPFSVAVDAVGNLYIADFRNNRIRKVDAATGTINTIAGMGQRGHGGDGGPATEAQLGPRDVAADRAGNLYIASGSRIRRVDPVGIISTIPHEVNPASVRGLVIDQKVNVYFTQSFTNLVRKFDPAAETTLTVAGGGHVDHFLAFLGKLSHPLSVAVDSFGNVYVADNQNHRIRRVSAFTGAIRTIAGTGERGYSGDGGPATEARLSSPGGVAVDAASNIYIADNRNNRIRKVDASTGTINTIAGSGERGYGGDGGPATGALLYLPGGVAVDGSGNVYIADVGNRRIRKVDVITGSISTIAGRGQWGYSGDGGPAIEARLASPTDVAVDGTVNVYIADAGNNRIRKIDAATGTITTIAGKGEEGYSGDGGPATEARFSYPGDVAVDSAVNVYIADAGNNRIRKIDAATGTITTIAGTGERGYSGDGGPATGARLSFPIGVTVGADCRLYVADTGNHRIRLLKPHLALESGGCASASAAAR